MLQDLTVCMYAQIPIIWGNEKVGGTIVILEVQRSSGSQLQWKFQKPWFNHQNSTKAGGALQYYYKIWEWFARGDTKSRSSSSSHVCKVCRRRSQSAMSDCRWKAILHFGPSI